MKIQKRLEVCVDSVESAVTAQESGADRLEVCANLVVGGTTPGVSQFKQIRRACGIELNVLVRPRSGDFLYTDAEFQMIVEDIQMFRELGADGNLDLERMRKLRRCADSLQMTLHRAFDVCRDPYQALEEAVSLGINTILTSGQAPVCAEGKQVLKKLIAQAGGRIEILVGSGVNAEGIRQLMEEIHASSFHMSGKKIISSGMIFRNQQIHMGLPGFGEFDIFRTDKEQIQRARQTLDKIQV